MPHRPARSHSIERMFPSVQGVDSWGHRPTLRICQPAQLVTVDLSPVLGWAFHTRRPPIGVSLETRAYGVRFGPDQPGLLVAWVRAASGMWVAIVDVTLVSANTKCSISERFWLPPEAVQRR